MCAETDQLINGLISMRIPIIASDVRGNDATHVRLPDSRQRGFALAVGSEATGLSVEMLAGASLKIRINQSREVESLNAAVAGSILMCKLYERDNAV
jgi:TrmH family RNA methyltransferase